MGLLSKLKSVFGTGKSGDSRGDSVDVTVERSADSNSNHSVEETPQSDTESHQADAEANQADTEPHQEDADFSSPTDTDAPPKPDTTASDSSTTAESVVAEGRTDDPVDTVTGIGPAYADRLTEAGVKTVGDLVEADPESLAAQTDLSTKRVTRWVDNAKNS